VRVEREHARAPLLVLSDLGVYAYRRDFHLRFAALAQSPFERQDSSSAARSSTAT
jgi:CMP-2-keto-3-deoxyoctulosonic acid synthetase